MVRTLISDKASDGILIPLRSLLPVLAEAVPEVQHTCWSVQNAYGYGLRVCEMEDALDRGEEVFVAWPEIVALAGDPEVILYDFRLSNEQLGVQFGLVDSSFLLVDGGDEKLHAALRKAFRDVKQT